MAGFFYLASAWTGAFLLPGRWAISLERLMDAVIQKATEIRPEALVLNARNGPVFEGVDILGDEFALSAGDGKGWLVFQRVSPGRATFQLLKLLRPCDPNPYPQVSSPGVLWSRQAVLEASQCIASYQAGVGLTA